MTIDNSERSLEHRFVETYDFHIGETVYYFTSNSDPVIANTIKYTPEVINRSGHSNNSEHETPRCTIVIPATNVIARSIMPDVGILQIKVIVNRYFSTEPDIAENIFVGYARIPRFEQGLCTLDFDSIMLETNRVVPKVNVQALCNNTFTDSVCGIKPDSVKRVAIVTVEDGGRKLISSEFGPIQFYLPAGKCTLDKTGEISFITACSNIDDSITLVRPFTNAVNGDQVTVYFGCRKDVEYCAVFYQNLINFVGMPYVPLKDPSENSITTVRL
jgi:hypothetical protein